MPASTPSASVGSASGFFDRREVLARRWQGSRTASDLCIRSKWAREQDRGRRRECHHQLTHRVSPLVIDLGGGNRIAFSKYRRHQAIGRRQLEKIQLNFSNRPVQAKACRPRASFPLFFRAPFVSQGNHLGSIGGTFAQRVLQARWPAVLFEQIVEGFVCEFLKRLHAFWREKPKFTPCLLVKLDALADHGDQPSARLNSSQAENRRTAFWFKPLLWRRSGQGLYYSGLGCALAGGRRRVAKYPRKSGLKQSVRLPHLTPN